MSGFCGQCGRPRDVGAVFCGGCGSHFEEVVRLCPTCGQHWPDVAASATVDVSAVKATEVITSTSPVRGCYLAEPGYVYFDGDSWFVARDLGGAWIPNVNEPVSAEKVNFGTATLIAPESMPEVPQLPRGPKVGPEYDSSRDCGNCGFELRMVNGVCSHCGSGSTGAVFEPGK